MARGFTLLAMLVVTGIIGLLTSVGRDSRTEQGLQALFERPAGEAKRSGPYLTKRVPPDPRGDPYQDRQPGGRGDFDLFSYGRGGRTGGTGGAEDIGNW